MTDLSYNAFQTGSTPPPQGVFSKYVSSPIKSAFSGAVNQIKSGYNETQQPASPLGAMGNLVKGGAHIAEGLVGIPGSLAAPVTTPIGNVANKIGSNLGTDNPDYQKFAMSTPGKVTAGVASGVNTTANIAGGVAGGMALGEGVGNIWSKGYSSASSGLDAATAARGDIAAQGVKSLTDITGQVSDFKNDLGTSFREGAMKIEKTNPQARFTLTPAQVDALNTLKNNKSFALPDYVRNTTIPENPAHIGSGEVHLTPSQAQDLITQLNKSTFTERASGLAVDQSKIGLTNEIKQSALKAFGGEKSDWAKVYSDYAKGATAIEKMSDIININKDAGPVDMNRSIQSIVKLGSSPEGKII